MEEQDKETPENEQEPQQDTEATEAEATDPEAIDAEATEAEATEPEATDAVSDEEEDEDEVKFVEDPTYEVDYKGDCAYEVKATVPAVNAKKQAEDLFDELQGEAEVPGFRPGRAPRKLIERKFAKAVRGEAEAKLVSAAFAKLLKDEDLHPIKMPDVEGLEDAKERKEDEPLVLTYKFEVSPRVELGKYRGIEVERPILEISEDRIKEAVDGLRERQAVFEPLKKGKAKDGDQVSIDFKGTIDGEEFPGGSASDYPYILGTKRFFPEFEEVLTGASPGKELTCTVTLPEDNPDKDLQGKQAEFTITIKEIQRRKVPKLTDDFAKQAGYESADDLREKVAEQLRSAASDQSQQITEGRAVTQVIEASTYEIPVSLIESASEDVFEDETRRLLSMRMPADVVREHEDEMRVEARKKAVNDIKYVVTLSEIGEAEGVEVTDEDFEQEVASLAERTGAATEMVSRYIEEGDRKSSYEGRIFRAKALQVVMDHATVTDKEVTQEELDKGDEPEAPEEEPEEQGQQGEEEEQEG